MLLKTVRVKNYKSFRDSGEIGLSPGFNVVVGQNNAGKTALLEALAMVPQEKQHRSLITHPTPTALIEGLPTIEAVIELTEHEALELAADHAPGGFTVGGQADETSVRAASHPSMRLLIQRTSSSVSGHIDGIREPDNAGRNFIVRRPALRIERVNGGQIVSLAGVICSPVVSRLYFFKAERLNVGEGEFGVNPILRADAANLPEVLNLLQSNPVRYAHFNHLVRQIFPQLRHISVEPVPNNRLRIRVWTIDPVTERADLAPSLSDSGTGIGQVLAILYVVLTAEHPRVIVIDEPQSFLHPGAVRKLFEVLRAYPQHQFIVSTHSPAALSASAPETILLVRQNEGESSVEIVDGSVSHQLRTLLSEVGVRLSDVFGADSVLWVEGKTEELCFPLIVSEVAQRALKGTVILGVLTTGEFEGRQGDITFEIYQRLSGAGALLPPAVGFVFDRERRRQVDMDDLTRLGGGRVRFLARRMFENYLLDAEAIAAVGAAIEGFGKTNVEGVNAWFAQQGLDRRFFAPGEMPTTVDSPSWVRDVAGAPVLAALFANLSETRVAYDKTKHGFELTKWLAKHKPESLRELANLLTELLPA